MNGAITANGGNIEVVLIDIRGRDRTVVIQELLTADSATISANFVVQFRVNDPHAAIHQVKNFEERLYSETQTAARRVLRGLSLDEVIASRDETFLNMTNRDGKKQSMKPGRRVGPPGYTPSP